MKSPENRGSSPDNEIVAESAKKEVERTIAPPDKTPDLPGTNRTPERLAEMDEIATKLAQLSRQLDRSVARDLDTRRAGKAVGRGETQKEKGTFGMLRDLWSVTPSDAKLALIGEFIFNPNQLKERHEHEMDFQRRLNNRWKK